MGSRTAAQREHREPGHDQVGGEHDEREADHRPHHPDRDPQRPPLAAPPAIEPPGQGQERRDEDRGELARPGKPPERRRRPEEAPVPRLQEPPEQPEDRRPRGEQGRFHRRQGPVREQVRSEREEPGGQGHRLRPVKLAAPERGQAERDEPDPEPAEADDRQELRLVADRVVHPGAESQAVERREDGDLLDLPEGQRRAHPGDLVLIAGPPPARGDPEIGDLVIRRRAAAERVDHQAEPGQGRECDGHAAPSGRGLTCCFLLDDGDGLRPHVILLLGYRPEDHFLREARLPSWRPIPRVGRRSSVLPAGSGGCRERGGRWSGRRGSSGRATGRPGRAGGTGR